MLATDKISSGFRAIVEEAEKMIQREPGEEIVNGLKTIISIAKHQNDIRGAKPGQCSSHAKCE